MDSNRQRGTRWWDFIAYRRQYVTNRTWYGAAVVAGALGSMSSTGGWVALAFVPILIIGIVLVVSGVRRSMTRSPDGRTPTVPL